MQELKFVVADSDASSLVLRAVDPAVGGPIAEYFLPVTDELRAFLSDAPTSSANSLNQATLSDTADGEEVPTREAASTDADDVPASTAAAESSTDTSANSPVDAADATDTASTGTAPAATGADKGDEEAEETEVASLFQGRSRERTQERGKHRSNARPHRTKIGMSPRVIQDRIRHGATVAELADEADTDESRIEPYAWPILQERSRIAELAHAALPVNGDGVSNQPLWEVLATALAAHGEALSDAEWDAFQNDSKQWIVTVSWEKDTAGRTAAHTAEFMMELRGSEKALAHPHNSIAGDLVNPRYGQPVRSVSPVTPLLHPTQGQGANNWQDEAARREEFTHSANDGATGAETTPPAVHGSPADLDDRGDNEFLIHPDAKSAKPKRKRKAVTPHWEDVLLGVRTNPKKKN